MAEQEVKLEFTINYKDGKYDPPLCNIEKYMCITCVYFHKITDKNAVSVFTYGNKKIPCCYECYARDEETRKTTNVERIHYSGLDLYSLIRYDADVLSALNKYLGAGWLDKYNTDQRYAAAYEKQQKR